MWTSGKHLVFKKTIVDAIQEVDCDTLDINRRHVDSTLFRVYKGDFSGKRPPLRWTDQIKKGTSLPIETAARQTMSRDERRMRNAVRARGIVA